MLTQTTPPAPTAPFDLSLSAEPASEKIANALQAIAGYRAFSGDDPNVIIHRAEEALRAAMENAQETEAQLGVAKQLLREAETERLAVIAQLKEQTPLEGYTEGRTHLTVDWPAGKYEIERTFKRTITDFQQARAIYKELRRRQIPS